MTNLWPLTPLIKVKLGLGPGAGVIHKNLARIRPELGGGRGNTASWGATKAAPPSEVGWAAKPGHMRELKDTLIGKCLGFGVEK
jgi:hypothetical protein